MFKPSPQQQVFFDWIVSGEGSCVVEAVAGSGKTTTLIHGLSLMRGQVYFGAYNKAIAEEIKSRTASIEGPDITVSTFHAAGFKAWTRVAGRGVRVDEKKVRNIFRTVAEGRDELFGLENCVCRVVGLAKQAGVGPLVDDSDETFTNLIDHFDVEIPDAHGTGAVIALVRDILQKSVALDREVIDFDDMIYSPLVHDVRMWQHDWVLVDEAQDTNNTRRALARKMLKKNGRLVAVGDPHQAIYGFTGADSDSLDLIREMFGAVTLPLSVTYRCPKAVVRHAQKYVGHITADVTAPEGEVVRGDMEQLTVIAQPGDAVLCRFNAPLVQTVYQFIGKGIPAKIEGREIGEGLKKLALKWKTKSLSVFEDRLADYVDRELEKLSKKERNTQARALQDKADCLAVLIQRVRSLNPDAQLTDLVFEIENLFADTTSGERRQVVTFSTIHKSKGREWTNVVWLETGPSKWAKKDWEKGQEVNLSYVATTRAKTRLCLVPYVDQKKSEAPAPAKKEADIPGSRLNPGKRGCKMPRIRIPGITPPQTRN